MLKKLDLAVGTDLREAERSVEALRQRVDALSAFANPFSESAPIIPSLSVPSDFVGKDWSEYSFLFETRSIALAPGQIDDALARDKAPIPRAQNREGYADDDDYHYWLSGYADYCKLTEIAKEHGVGKGTLFDFGGSTGRVFRNFHYQGDWDIWSNDFKQSSVEWNLENMPRDIKVFQGLYHPYLPIESNGIDLIIAMSVFTHIDEIETNWLLELRRVLRPNGLALLTIHNQATWEKMGGGLLSAIQQHNPEWLENTILPSGRHVSNFRYDDPYRCNVFHTDDFIRQNWGRYFDVVNILPRASSEQAVVVLRK